MKASRQINVLHDGPGSADKDQQESEAYNQAAGQVGIHQGQIYGYDSEGTQPETSTD